MPERLAGTRIAIIEDDAPLRESLALFLRVKGCRVETFGCAEDVGDAAKPGRFDIVISDYLLPGEDGLSFLRRVREVSRDVGTLLITAYAGNVVPMEAGAAGVGAFLAKPFSTMELEAALLRIVEGGDTRGDGMVEAI